MGTKNVYEVKSVDLQLKESLPPFVLVKASGTVRTGGWTNARLEPAIYITPPLDGIQDLNFVADEPTGPSTDGIEKVDAELDMGRVADWMRGVRVLAETNQIEETF